MIKIKPFDLKEFFDFIGQQGVVGLAIGFILGGAISKVITALVDDIVNPLLGVVFGATASLAQMSLHIGSVVIAWGDFVNTLIDFLVIALVVYLVAKWLRLETIEGKKN